MDLAGQVTNPSHLLGGETWAMQTVLGKSRSKYSSDSTKSYVTKYEDSRESGSGVEPRWSVLTLNLNLWRPVPADIFLTVCNYPMQAPLMWMAH